jgi:hypothetical protein
VLADTPQDSYLSVSALRDANYYFISNIMKIYLIDG